MKTMIFIMFFLKSPKEQFSYRKTQELRIHNPSLNLEKNVESPKTQKLQIQNPNLNSENEQFPQKAEDKVSANMKKKLDEIKEHNKRLYLTKKEKLTVTQQHIYKKRLFFNRYSNKKI